MPGTASAPMVGDRAGAFGQLAIWLQCLDRLLRGVVEQERPERAMLDQQQSRKVVVEPDANDSIRLSGPSCQ